MSSRILSSSSSVPVPRSLVTLVHLVIGGFAALGFWEVWANWPTQLATGFPLEPPALVKLLFWNQFGISLSNVSASALHYVTGVTLYPAGYWILSRFATGKPAVDGWIWGAATYVLALGVFAPLAGLPFLLIGDNIQLSVMSLIGHAVFGYILALVFDALERAPA